MIEKFPIKVLFLAEELRLGGAETYFSTLEERLDRSKVHFHLMAVSKSKKLADQLRYPDQFDEYGFSPASRISKIAENYSCQLSPAGDMCSIGEKDKRGRLQYYLHEA